MLTLPASAIPERPEATDLQTLAEEDAALLRGIASRWLENGDAMASSTDPGLVLPVIIGRLQEVAGSLEQLIHAVPPPQSEGAKTDDTALPVPTGVLTKEEWLALVRTSVRYLNSYSELSLSHRRHSLGP